MTEPAKKLNPLGNNNYQDLATPWWFTNQLRGQHGYQINLDVCADAENAVAPVWFDKTQDGLKRDWDIPVGWAWCNPPFRECKVWVDKARHEARENETSTLLLLPAAIGAEWFRLRAPYARKVRIIVPRLNYYCAQRRELLTGVAYNSCLWEITPASVRRPQLHGIQIEYLEARKPKDSDR